MVSAGNYNKESIIIPVSFPTKQYLKGLEAAGHTEDNSGVVVFKCWNVGPEVLRLKHRGEKTKSKPRMAECQDLKMHYLKIPTILQSCTRELPYLDNMGITFL